MRWLLMVMMLGLAVPGLAKVYRCENGTGQVSYQQMPCPQSSGVVAPLEVSKVTADAARNTLDRYVQAVHAGDQRGQLSMLADDFELLVYDTAAFDYVRDRFLKADVAGQAESARMFAQISHLDLLAFEPELSGTDRYQVRVRQVQKSGGAVLARLELAVVNGQLLIQRWEAVR